jgi:ribosomal protein S18 acetylase RimI-like enzyme
LSFQVRLRRTTAADLAWVVAQERHPGNRELVGQWTDAQHLDAIHGRGGREHWLVERDGERAGYLICLDGRQQGGGIYVKRVLVTDKERGTGQAAMRAYLDEAFSRPGTDFVWLNVRDWNARAQACYRKAGMEPWEPEAAELWRIAHGISESMGGVTRMRITSGAWRSRAS